MNGWADIPACRPQPLIIDQTDILPRSVCIQQRRDSEITRVNNNYGGSFRATRTKRANGPTRKRSIH